MIEKINNPHDVEPWVSGYFKPKGKEQKRACHKEARRLNNDFYITNRKGLYNRVGVVWEWS